MDRPPGAHEPGLGADPHGPVNQRVTGRASPARSRAESRSVTRKELLRAAAGLFLRDGFVATSLADIAGAAGVTKGAVYSNFESKEDLFLALLAEPASASEMYAPRQLDGIVGDGVEAGRQFGRHAEGVRPSRPHVALFLEANAVALRSERARAVAAANTRAFAIELGARAVRAARRPRRRPADVGVDRPVALHRAAHARRLPRRGRRRDVRGRVRGPRRRGPPAGALIRPSAWPAASTAGVRSWPWPRSPRGRPSDRRPCRPSAPAAPPRRSPCPCPRASMRAFSSSV